MKAKYVVFYENGFDENSGHPSYTQVKSFRNEPEALAFISDQKNVRWYGELFLECHRSDGKKFEWHSRKQEWIEK